jgi:hypothetical protein
VGASLTTPSLTLFETDGGSKSLQQGTDVAVVLGAFAVAIPADTFFSLSS